MFLGSSLARLQNSLGANNQHGPQSVGFDLNFYTDTLIETAKLSSVDPQAWLADVLGRIADHKIPSWMTLAMELRSALSVTGYAQPPKVGDAGRSPESRPPTSAFEATPAMGCLLPGLRGWTVPRLLGLDEYERICPRPRCSSPSYRTC